MGGRAREKREGRKEGGMKGWKKGKKEGKEEERSILLGPFSMIRWVPSRATVIFLQLDYFNHILV